jgi:hypothetical protein
MIDGEMEGIWKWSWFNRGAILAFALKESRKQ